MAKEVEISGGIYDVESTYVVHQSVTETVKNERNKVSDFFGASRSSSLSFSNPKRALTIHTTAGKPEVHNQ